MHYTNAPVIIDERVPRHRGPRRALLRLGPDERPVRHLELAVQGHGDAQPGRGSEQGSARRGEQAGHGGHGGEPVARRAAGRGRDAAASALRLPAAEAALRALHAGARRRDLRLHASRSSSQVAEALCAQLGPRADARLLLRGRLDAAHGRRADTSAPPRSSSCCSATSAGRAAASWRCAATRRSRARRTSRRSTTSCPATCRCRTPTTTATSSDYIEANIAPTGWWGHFDAVHRSAC